MNSLTDAKAAGKRMAVETQRLGLGDMEVDGWNKLSTLLHEDNATYLDTSSMHRTGKGHQSTELPCYRQAEELRAGK